LLPQDRFLDGLNQAENLKESYDNATSIISAFLKKSAAVFRINSAHIENLKRTALDKY